MRIILELIRIIAIILLFGAVLGGGVNLVYTSFGINVDNTNGDVFVAVAILILLFVWYRNKLQFSGFYKGQETLKLPKKVSVSLIICSMIILVIAPFIN